MSKDNYPKTRAAIAEYKRSPGSQQKIIARDNVFEAFEQESGRLVDETMTPSFILWLIDNGLETTTAEQRRAQRKLR